MSQQVPRILVAEDNPVMLDVIRYNLHRAGFEVVTAKDGAEAIFHLEQESFDVVLLDNQMPVISGIEVCQHPVRMQCHPTTPFIMCSAKGLEMDDATITELNLHSMIFKPFSPRDLVATIKAVVEQAVVA
jgi:two-component system alkaline phosphatase synthesis response regulator PhoP